jgi:hypothetical protein
MGGACNTQGSYNKCIANISQKTERKETTWNTHKLEDIIKMNHKEIGKKDVDWINLARIRNNSSLF